MHTIFYFTGNRDPREIAQGLSLEGNTRWAPGGELLISGVSPEADGGVEFRFIFQTHPGRAIHALSHRPVDLLLVDNRRADGDETSGPFSETPGARLLTAFMNVPAESSLGIKKRRILFILGEGDSLPEEAFEAGNLRVGGVIVEPFKRGGLLKAIDPHLGQAEGGKLAFCLAGGGVEGLIYELGVLIALDRVMVNKKVTDFDIFCGISAGAIISSFVANGVAPEEVARGFQFGSDKIEIIPRSTIFWPNFREVYPRIFKGLREAVKYNKNVDVEALIWGLVPSGAMNGENIKWYIEKQLTKPGMTNNFNQLGRELYIGVTDQDNSNHVILGEPGLRDIPISHAVCASSALAPFYHPQKIRDRYYIDGAFTRTTNIRAAVGHGAGLVVVVNPWVPFQSSEPGEVYKLGGAFTTLQAIKALVSTRFYHDFENADELFPDTCIHLFTPEGEELKEMRGTLMRFFYRMKLVDIAYRRTIQKIRERYEIMERDFRRFGIELVEPDLLDDESITKQLMDEDDGKIVSFPTLRRTGSG